MARGADRAVSSNAIEGSARPGQVGRRPGTRLAAAPARPRRRKPRHHREQLLFIALVAPNLLLIAVFSYWPVIYNFYLSLTQWDLIAPTPIYIGFRNYADLFHDPEFGAVMRNSVEFTGAVVVGSMLFGLAIAVLFNQRLRGRGVVRTLAFAPHIVSGAAVATLWLFIFDPNYGLSRSLLQPLGISPPSWTTSEQWALPGLIIVYLWKGIGFTAIVYLAGLQSMPTEIYEAARIDGAGRWTLFRRITFPLLSPVTFFLLVTSIIGTFQAYDLTAVMTNGGPGTATTTLSWYIYQQAFKAQDIGHASAAAVILFLILVAVTTFQVGYIERRVHYT